MKPSKIPEVAAKWPEYLLGGGSKAPRGWMFFLSDECDEFGPMTMTAVDEGGQARAYHRHGYLPKAVSGAVNAGGWMMFSGGAIVAVAAMTFLSCTFVLESEDMGSDTGSAPASNTTGKINTTSSSSTSSGGTSTGPLVDDEDDTLDTPSLPDTPETLDDTPQTLGEGETETGSDDSDGGEWVDPIYDPCVSECMQDPTGQNAEWCDFHFDDEAVHARCMDLARDAETMWCVRYCEWGCY